MYRREQILISSKESLNNYIEKFDVYNSYFLKLLNDQTIERHVYEITVYEYRPDLIAMDFYGSEKYMGILMAQVHESFVDGYKKGNVLSLIPKVIIDSFIKEI